MRLDHFTDFYFYFNQNRNWFGAAFFFSNDLTHSRNQTNRIFFSPIQSRHMIIFQAILLSFPHMPRVANIRPSYSTQMFFSGTASTPQNLIKLQRSCVLKELPNGDMIFAFFFFCFWPLRCSTPTLKVNLWTSSPSHLHLGIFSHVFTNIWMLLNKFFSALDLLDCQITFYRRLSHLNKERKRVWPTCI